MTVSMTYDLKFQLIRFSSFRCHPVSSTPIYIFLFGLLICMMFQLV